MKQKKTEDTFMSYHFWLTTEEVSQIEEMAKEHHMQPATVVQRILKYALKELQREKITPQK